MLEVGVLGSDGYVGSYLCENLNKNKNVKLYRINKKNYKKYNKQYFDYLIDCSNNSKKYLSEKNFQEDFKKSCVNTLKNCKSFIYKKYILISSIDVYDEISNVYKTKENSKIDLFKLSNYGLNKFMSEQIIIRNCKSWIILRLSGMIGGDMKKGPVFDLLNQIKLGLTGDTVLPIIHLKKVFELIEKVIFKEIKLHNEILNLTTNNSLDLSKISTLLERKPTFKKNAKYRKIKINNTKLKKIFNPGKTEDSIKEFLEK